jgi:aspartyl-tRNA(Asn)/glutamyl-tRNA(Gln) amidotransferase subunit B
MADGGEIEQETLHFDPRSGSITSLRSKEEAHDYRYFPEPDLVPLAPTEEMVERARSELPELPGARAERLERDLGLPEDTAKLLAFRQDLGDFFEAALDGVEPRVLANWVTNELAAVGIGKTEPQAFASLVAMVAEKQVSQSAGREVLAVLAAQGGDPASIVESQGLSRAGEDELSGIVERAIEQQADAVEKIKGGNDKAIGAIVGAVMKETKGRADGGEVQRMIRERIT